MIPADQTVTRVWAEWLADKDHHKAHAFDTPFRYSDAMGCARALSYKAAQFAETDPMDGASLAIAGMGSLLHEDIQQAALERWPDARFEVGSAIEDLISGHVDIDIPSDSEVAELKTVGAYKFDQSIGLKRSPGRGKPAYFVDGKGPSLAHICQAGFNARGLGRDTVRLVYVSREAVAVKKARDLGMTSLDRFTAEWVFTEDEWGPIVDQELARLRGIRTQVDAGMISDRIDLDDDATELIVTPDKHWRCDYCPFQHQCRMDGSGVIPLPKEAA